MKTFDKKEYDLNFRKSALKEKKKAQFNTDLDYEEKQEIDELLKKAGMSKAQFIRAAKVILERKIEMKEKINKIESMIEGIIENAINTYLEKWDTTSGSDCISIEDWKLGTKGTVRDCSGNILNYVSYDDFKDLYSNFKYDLNSASEDTLNKIIAYLENESQYTDYNDLDRDGYTISEFKEMA